MGLRMSRDQLMRVRGDARVLTHVPRRTCIYARGEMHVRHERSSDHAIAGHVIVGYVIMSEGKFLVVYRRERSIVPQHFVVPQHLASL